MEGPQQQRELRRQWTDRVPADPRSGDQHPLQPLSQASTQMPPSTHHTIALCSRYTSLPPAFAQPESSEMPPSPSCQC